MNSTAKSSIVRLVSYITDTQDKVSRIAQTRIRNCIADYPQDAAREMEAVQLLNKRSKADKTYHLLLSFPTGEEPTDEQLADIEDDICTALGFTDHQRISVVHRDTDNFHMHLAINKIHPEKLTIHEPRRDFHILAKAAERIEKSYQLIKTNHTPKKSLSENRIDDAEKMSGQESFATYIKTHCLDELRAAKSWDDIHTVCSDNGINLKLRGNGMVFIQDQDNGKLLAVKASTVAREFSKSKLEKKLGKYYASFEKVADSAKISRTYTSKQKPKRPASPLWKKYMAARQNWLKQSAMEKTRIAEERSQRKKLIELLYKTEKATNRFSSVPYWQKRYRLLGIRKEMSSRRKAFNQKNHVGGYLQWLQKQAISGDQDALTALRRRAFGLAKKVNAFLVKNNQYQIDDNLKVDNVTKQGTVIYAVGKNIIRDRGDLFQISNTADSATLAMAMQMAAHRSGNRLTITGGEAFKEKCIQIAVDANLNMVFANAKLEAKRKSFIAHEKQNAISTQ